ncbi:MAG: hypothetical protein K0S11_1547 [Gammaproteobacteria bacterium]|jgi:hypothetical protein|nr:hypothetical protein [Gammaproteobacteria bacterium]
MYIKMARVTLVNGLDTGGHHKPPVLIEIG